MLSPGMCTNRPNRSFDYIPQNVSIMKFQKIPVYHFVIHVIKHLQSNID